MDSIRNDLEQLQSMYEEVLGCEIMPFSLDAELRWREREADLASIVERATRALTTEHPVYPLAVEALSGAAEDAEPVAYRRRYFCVGDIKPCFSLGVMDPLAGHSTPIWLRMDGETPGYAVLDRRLHAATHSHEIVRSHGASWIPIDLPLERAAPAAVAEIVDQVESIVRTATGEQPGSA